MVIFGAPFGAAFGAAFGSAFGAAFGGLVFWGGVVAAAFCPTPASPAAHKLQLFLQLFLTNVIPHNFLFAYWAHVYVPEDPNVSTQGSIEADLGVEEAGAVAVDLVELVDLAELVDLIELVDLVDLVDLVAGTGGGMGDGAGGVVEATETGATKR